MLLSYLQVGILGSLLPRRCVKLLHAHYESWHRRVCVCWCSRLICLLLVLAICNSISR